MRDLEAESELMEFFQRNEREKPRAAGIPQPFEITVEERRFETHSFSKLPVQESGNGGQTLGPPPPRIDSVSPGTIAASTTPTTLTIVGIRFYLGPNGEVPTVQIKGVSDSANGVTIEAGDVVHVNNEKVTCVVSPSNVGLYDVTLTLWSGQKATKRSALLVQEAPYITSVTPNTGPTLTRMTVEGAHFGTLLNTAGLFVGGFQCYDVFHSSDTKIQGNVPAGLPDGVYDISVVNRYFLKGVLTGGFTIGSAAPPPPPPPPPVATGGTLDSPYYAAAGSNRQMPVNVNWPVSLSGASEPLRLVCTAGFYTIYASGGATVGQGQPSVTITPSTTINSPGTYYVFVSAPFPPLGGTLLGSIDLVLYNSIGPVPTYGNPSSLAPYRYSLGLFY